MKTTQVILGRDCNVTEMLKPILALEPDLVFVFGAPSFFEQGAALTALTNALGSVSWMGCSTAGEIFHTGVKENSLVVTGIRFADSVSFRTACVGCCGMEGAREAGQTLASQLAADDLAGVFMLAPGVNINGSALIAGVSSVLGQSTPVSGGLAGDGGAFVRTYTALNGLISESSVVGVGFYGRAIEFLTGSFGGWRSFGPLRKVTRSTGNVLYEMDGEPALALYKRYLGEYASGLPGTGLLFPLAITDGHDDDRVLIRTLIGINDEEESLTFAGDIPMGVSMRMMQASVNSLVDGAQLAAEATASAARSRVKRGLALLVSCVGRKLVMAGRVEEEVEAVADALGLTATVAGFYSHGEITPGSTGTDCHLHNQTMTVTYITDE